jgi:hypothetical protein
MLFLEIFLTIAAWKRGYKGWALLPFLFAVAIGFIIGASSPQSLEGDKVWNYIWIDILAVVALVIMIAAGNSVKIAKEADETEEPLSSKAELPEH